jgi:tRNA pseudouridine-54 N-methylase
VNLDQDFIRLDGGPGKFGELDILCAAVAFQD